ncbi:hypothetical protein A3D05_06435 [Candidatus Gottesmanbacteria bacterium RIFCSPHIGHO2_02_FULL_40_24]|uniref:Uncharacterized protein n=1 Tax=Candidatus Gottesmanbacteria bacterium RIFCSPHIGHO2_01_FULL_40_15 TaxID=1798376 RepID=A0A1F5YZD1_9BACT|nr:MAG: hypothetical protein A2777_06370 [Candidatus Gottesmanbacteria bacterium RIFCSPHIGHO2_01_FULL_40_15]OGG16922.1 MAG: hypothetical protein A3D05_06435 [Candidatus Gottesmanbacteria bacterium RIFCSPHIGHO2_02_FULL_40_24]OGG22299.1 MAG: hypothetical protein A3B48_06265 [Candidatus Gottesmanbacteria bacterium RIFCSPLOWO2_01_FULL_40_10]OGG23469.1 MAG: hypothetical protein A3E42_00350 [Candidatus Gottesmanbacteria bacterium RIFCSPHIGHO2_12_FULL_40_13]
MENNILLFTILGLTFVTALSQVFMLLLNNMKKHPGIDEMSDDELEEYQQKSREVLHDASKKANKILTNAELKGIEYIARQKLDIEKLVSDFNQQTRGLEGKLIEQFKISLEKTEKTYADYINVLQENLRQEEMKNQRLFQEKSSKMIDNAQQVMSAFIMDINNKMKIQIDEELKVIRNELETYKKHRFEVINKNIVDILEKTLEETLGKKLSLTEHSEIIFQSLEQAKQDHNLT